MGTWQGAGTLGHLALALSGAVNAVYFGVRSVTPGGPTQLAAGVLALLFLGVALRGAIPIVEGMATLAALIHAAPLLVGTLLASLLLALGAGR